MITFTAYERELLKELKGVCKGYLKAYNDYNTTEMDKYDIATAYITECAKNAIGDLISEEFYNLVFDPDTMGDEEIWERYVLTLEI